MNAHPEPNPTSPARRWQERLVDLLQRPPCWLLLIVGVAVLVARRPDGFRNPQFWAEDGYFYEMAFRHGWHALLEPYAGYFHLVPRFVGALAVQLDPQWAPAVFVGSAVAGTLYVALRARAARCPLPWAPVCALAVVLVPDASEVLLNVANLQWILAAALVLLLLSADGRRWWQHAHDGLAAVVLGLTGPFSMLLAPLFAWRAWSRRTRPSVVLAVLIAACGSLQLWTIWHNPQPLPPETTIDYGALLPATGMRVAGSLLVGGWVPLDYPRPVETALGLLTLGAVGALAVRRGPLRVERAWLGLAFGAILASSLFRCRFVLPHLCHASFGARYFFPIQLLTLWLLIEAAAGKRPPARFALVVLVLALAVNVPRLRETTMPDYRWADYVPKIRAGEPVVVPINPPGWTFTLPARKP